MAPFTRGNVVASLLWLTLVTPCLLSGGLDALPVQEENDETVTDASSDPNACNSDEFRCNNSECIGRGLVCDSEKHCTDGSDESKSLCLKPGTPPTVESMNDDIKTELDLTLYRDMTFQNPDPVPWRKPPNPPPPGPAPDTPSPFDEPFPNKPDKPRDPFTPFPPPPPRPPFH